MQKKYTKSHVECHAGCEISLKGRRYFFSIPDIFPVYWGKDDFKINDNMVGPMINFNNIRLTRWVHYWVFDDFHGIVKQKCDLKTNEEWSLQTGENH